jgi:hypothetical protein
MVKRLQDFRSLAHCGILCEALLRFCFEVDLKDVVKCPAYPQEYPHAL